MSIGFSVAMAKMIVIGVLFTGLVVAVIILGVKVSKLQNEIDSQPQVPTSIPITSTTEDLSLLQPWEREYRLSDNVIPSHYDLSLNPVFTNLQEGVEPTFSGSIVLKFSIKNEKQDYITIHEKNLKITSADIYRVTGGGINPIHLNVDHFESARNEFYVFTPLDAQAEFIIGDYELNMEFSGSLNQTEIVGFYASSYTDTEGSHQLVTSKFEPTYARRAFPCMDEPQKKATFAISLVKDKNEVTGTNKWTALSNMGELSTADFGTNQEKVTFKTSVPMSTYLVCFVISEFKSYPDPAELIDNLEGDAFPLLTWSQPELIDYTKEAFTAAKMSLAYYINDYFQIPYALDKLDLIAIPDFVSGAMENWGLITFRETNMIYNEVESSTVDRQKVNGVVAHEVAHMWFGNLVTMKWWDDLWLNEGFATFMQYKAVNSYHNGQSSPDDADDWQMLNQFVLDELQPVLALDAQLSSHPVIQHVEHPDQITEIFDTITYSKGSSVLRMLENFLTEKVFMKGIQNYLNAFKFGNAATPDLWAQLQLAVDEDPKQDVDVAHVMDTWTLQMGLPVVNVKLTPNPTGGGALATVTQSRFLATNSSSKKRNKAEIESPYGYKWDIPITWTEKNMDSEHYRLNWLKMNDPPLSVAIEGSWLKVNKDQTGFYRVNYDADTWYQLTLAYFDYPPADPTTYPLTPVDRSSLLDDAFSLAEAGLLDYRVALDLSMALIVEDEYIPWVTASSRFNQMTPLMRGKLAYKKYTEFLQNRVTLMYTKYSVPSPTDPAEHIKKLLQSTILNFACSVGLPECLQYASDEFKKFTDAIPNPPTPIQNDIKPDLRLWAYIYGMQYSGNAVTWETVWNYYLVVTDPQERTKLQRCLASISDAAVLEMYVELAWNEAYVKGQDYFKVLEYISDNPVGTSIVWDYVRSNWDKLVERFTLNNRYLGNLIPAITKTFDTELKHQEMRIFFAENPDAGAGANARAQALERVEANIIWVAERYPVIAQWLSAWKVSP